MSKPAIMGTTMGKNGPNFLDALPSQGTMHVVMLGLDSAGKTTALYRLKFDQYLNTVPTIGFNCEKVQGSFGKAKGVQFLVWDVGGQEKLRPLWRSYTRCTDGILFVVDSVDVERMEEAKIELMRTAKCPDNQGVPVLILANKQDLPGARDPKQLETLLGLNELVYPGPFSMAESRSCSNGENLKSSCSSSNCFNRSYEYGCSSTPNLECDKKLSFGLSNNIINMSKHTNFQPIFEPSSANASSHTKEQNQQKIEVMSTTSPTTMQIMASNEISLGKKSTLLSAQTNINCKGWHIQPACAITGEGLQEGLEVLYEMILKRRKLNKSNKKKR